MSDTNRSLVAVRILRGDQFSRLVSASADLQKNLDTLWPPKGVITCGPENRFIVVFETADEERIIALAKLVENQTGKGRIIGTIHDVVVDEAFQGKGIGSLLIQSIIRYCKTECFDVLELTCRPEREAANHLYQKEGFQLQAAACDGGTNYYRYIF